MKLAMELGLGPGHIVFDGIQLPFPKGHRPPIFGPCLLWLNGWLDQDATWYGGRPRPRRHCVRCWPSSHQKGTASAPIFGPCLLWLNGWMDQDATWYEGRLQSRRHCVRCGTQLSAKKEACDPHFSALVYCGQMVVHLSYCLALVLVWLKAV